jgi:hypothetical protein
VFSGFEVGGKELVIGVEWGVGYDDGDRSGILRGVGI